MVWIILLVLIVIAAGALVIIYNRLIALRQRRRNAFSDIDVQLKQRYDLIPQLVETVKGYASHEQETLQNVTDARTQVSQTSGDNQERMSAESQLGGAMMNLFAVAENYPDLKADENFQHLQSELSDLENKIAAARRFFNSATSEYNTAIEQFPANLVAGPLGFTSQPFFELDKREEEAVRERPEIDFS